ncbi:MAG: YggS family pyridoxal phosphate-dependent enzyme [Lachnospiraceae bacterium]|nr:YggS family pyridoxal phosphate-dependent enzyme [Lachnospiraceae bacterium]
MIKENLETVKKNIAAACEKAGRDPGEVTLIAVSKTKPVEMLKEAYDAGVRDFGENRVQELVEKYDQMPGDVRWHLIGHLQTNKVKYIVDKVCMIHSVDSLKLAKEISSQAVKHNVTVDILLEVNVAEEETKFGTSSEGAVELAKEVSKLPGINIRGLMTVAPYVVDPEENRQVFVALSKLAVDITPFLRDNHNVVLSMGMSNDYQVAVTEGATCVRVGTGIFGERDYGKI